MLFVAITIILIAIIILYILVVRSTPKTTYYSVTVDPKEIENTKVVDERSERSEKEKMFERHFPKIENEIKMDYPLKPIGCCPPSKEMSKDLPVANIPICYAKNSKTYLS
jgi:hypothetical protein